MKINDCPFCSDEQRHRDIIVGQYMRVMYPKNPSCAYHVLITPLRHTETFDHLTDMEVLELYRFVKQLKTVISSKLGDEYIGYNLLANNGSVKVNQHIMHSHMHMYNRMAHAANDPVKTRGKDKVYILTTEEEATIRQLQTWMKAV